MTPIRTLLVLGVALAATLTGCAASAPAGDPSAAAAPQTTPTPGSESTPVDVIWLGASALLVEGTVNGCAPVLHDLRADAQSLAVTLAFNPASTCEAVPMRFGIPVPIPAGVDTAQPVAVTVDGVSELSVTMPARADGGVVPEVDLGGVPAVAWLGGSEFAFLTYGSSSCAPTEAAIDVTGDGTATVRFDPDAPETRVCTADYAPRVTFVDAPDVPADTVFTLHGFTNEDGSPTTVTP